MYYKIKNSTLELNIMLQPNSRLDKIFGVHDDTYLKISIIAPAVEGKANKYLIEYLAKTLKIAKSRITVSKGSLNRYKKILISDLDTLPAALNFIS